MRLEEQVLEMLENYSNLLDIEIDSNINSQELKHEYEKEWLKLCDIKYSFEKQIKHN